MHLVVSVCLILLAGGLLASGAYFVRRGWQAHRAPLTELSGQVARLEAVGREERGPFHLYLATEDSIPARFDIPEVFFTHLRVGDRIWVRFFPGMQWIRELRILAGRHAGLKLHDSSAASQAPGWWSLAALLLIAGLVVLTRLL